MKQASKKMSYTQLVALGFFLIIAVGTLLLMLPIASNGTPPGFTDAFFTATSATCVTGLVVYDTFTQWTVFGQIVILTMIQIGGLGFMTIMSLFSFLFGKRIGLRSRELLKESVNTLQLGGIVKLIKKVLIGTVIVEGAGAVILSWRFIPVFGWGRGIYYGVFHSVSAFCNAGFDLIGVLEPYSSFAYFYDDSIIMFTLSALILIGGIGFFIWDDVTKNRWHFGRYKLHSKIAIIVTAGLTLFGTLAIYLFERENTLAGMNAWDKFAVSLFSSVTPRTAGFNVLDTAALSDGSKFITMLLMAIGGSPGSTAGGIKTTTIAALFITAWSSVRHTRSDNVYGRRLDESAIKRAAAVMSLYLVLVIVGAVTLCATSGELALTDVMFETISAASTVGISTGITRALTPVARWAIILLMYCGRVGSVSFLTLFTEKKSPAPVVLPKEEISIG